MKLSDNAIKTQKKPLYLPPDPFSPLTPTQTHTQKPARREIHALNSWRGVYIYIHIRMTGSSEVKGNSRILLPYPAPRSSRDPLPPHTMVQLRGCLLHLLY